MKAKTRTHGEYHPGQLSETAFTHDVEPPMSRRDVDFGDKRPALYDAHERPIYRRIGYAPLERRGKG